MEPTGIKVASEAKAQPASDRGISKDVSTNAYFLVPELTMPHKNWKTEGRNCAKTFDTHKLNQTISTQVKIQTTLTPPSLDFSAAVAPTTIGTAMRRASGKTYTKYRVMIEKFKILL